MKPGFLHTVLPLLVLSVGMFAQSKAPSPFPYPKGTTLISKTTVEGNESGMAYRTEITTEIRIKNVSGNSVLYDERTLTRSFANGTPVDQPPTEKTDVEYLRNQPSRNRGSTPLRQTDIDVAADIFAGKLRADYYREPGSEMWQSEPFKLQRRLADGRTVEVSVVYTKAITEAEGRKVTMESIDLTELPVSLWTHSKTTGATGRSEITTVTREIQ